MIGSSSVRWEEVVGHRIPPRRAFPLGSLTDHGRNSPLGVGSVVQAGFEIQVVWSFVSKGLQFLGGSLPKTFTS